MKRPDERPVVILVDDEPQALAALKRSLRDQPYQVLATDDPFEAWSWIRSKPVGVIIADEFMPTMLGTELLEAARRERPGSGSIVLTGYPHTTVGTRASDHHVDILMFKPWNDNDLRDCVRRLLERRKSVRS
jgi:response regulator RpfG family c-di-GMP phosphodiesterase